MHTSLTIIRMSTYYILLLNLMLLKSCINPRFRIKQIHKTVNSWKFFKFQNYLDQGILTVTPILWELFNTVCMHMQYMAYNTADESHP